MGDVILIVDGYESSYSTSLCRICHEEELDRSKRLETPCACSGTVKFAHRDCVQRWCNEKGDTTCEICLKTFEPGYTAPPKKAHQVDTQVIFREISDVRRGEDAENQQLVLMAEETVCYSEYSFTSYKNSSWFRTAAVIFTIVLLVRHIVTVVTVGAGNCPFSLLTVILLRASGILLPMYAISRVASAIQNSIRHHLQDYEDNSGEEDNEEGE